MKTTPESTPSGSPSEFDSIVGVLKDPYLENMHEIATRIASLVTKETSPRGRAQVEDYLDSLWRYHGHKITITGWAREILPNYTTVLRYCEDEPVVSHGFQFYSTLEDPTPQISHLISFADTLNVVSGSSKNAGLLCLEDVIHMKLPELSTEARAVMFAHYHPDEAYSIRKLADASLRDDQILHNIGNFDMEVDFDTELGKDTALDCAAYLKTVAAIESDANYEVRLSGEMLVLDAVGEATPIELQSKKARTVKITDIFMRPADTTVTRFEGKQWCVPYVELIEFRSGGDLRLLLPVGSLDYIRSLRYKTDPQPTEPKNSKEPTE